MDVDKMHQSPEEAPTSASGSGSTEPLSASALARRRALFKGIGKGGAVIAASVPIQTLASPTLLTFDGLICSVSGMQSGVHSATPGQTATCGGYSAGHWGTKEPNVNPAKPKYPQWYSLPNGWTYETPFKNVFGSWPNSSANPTLFDAAHKSAYRSMAEFHWVCAWMNAVAKVFNFPYTPDEVVDFYKLGPASQTYRDALAFFSNYMEQM